MLRLLRALVAQLSRLERWLDPPACVPASPDSVAASKRPLLVAAIEQVTWAQATYPNGNGEYKRHKVYAKLIKQFPTASRRQIGLAIEQALSDEDSL